MTMRDTQHENQLDEILAAYLEATGAGWAPNRGHLLRCYPHLAGDLSRFFAGQDAVDHATAVLRVATPQPESALPERATLGYSARAVSTDCGAPQVPGYDVH